MRNDSDESFRTFVATWSPGLLRTAFLLTSDHGHAEDLLQTALLKTSQRWRRLANPDTAYNYVRTVMVNTHISWHRRRRVTEHLVDDVTEQAPAAHEHFTSVERTAAALAALPPGMRAVLVLRFHDDLSEAQTAVALGCSVGNVKSQTSRALERMRRHLGVPAAGADDTISSKGTP